MASNWRTNCVFHDKMVRDEEYVYWRLVRSYTFEGGTSGSLPIDIDVAYNSVDIETDK